MVENLTLSCIGGRLRLKTLCIVSIPSRWRYQCSPFPTLPHACHCILQARYDIVPSLQ